MKILLTGHKGFIGSNMLAMLADHQVTTFEWGDTLPNVNGHDWVIHMGANSSTTERDIEKIMMQNLDFSVWLLKQCIEHSVDFQYSSSASIYGLRKSNFTEDAPVDPRNPYAWTKYLFEHHVNNIPAKSLKGIRVQGFRYFNVYGPNEEHKNNMASPHHTFAKQYRETGKIKLFENSQNYLRDFIHVSKVCQMHIDFLDVRESGVWNVGTGTPTSFLDVALSIAPKEAIEFVPMPDILRDNYQEYTCADMTKTLESLKHRGEKL
jgi:ADP-L-glycero-D-manno-heptose 6-epimerase